MVFQSYALYPEPERRPKHRFRPRNAPRAAGRARKGVRDTARLLQIENLLDRKPASFRRPAPARRDRPGPVRNPEVFLFDEPLSNLDAKLRWRCAPNSNACNQMLKTTVVYVTHDQIEAMTLATRIAVMRDGRIEQLATPGRGLRPAPQHSMSRLRRSPPMKHSRRRGVANGLKLDGCEEVLSLPAAFNGAASAGRRVKVGIRPEALRLAAGQRLGD